VNWGSCAASRPINIIMLSSFACREVAPAFTQNCYCAVVGYHWRWCN